MLLKNFFKSNRWQLQNELGANEIIVVTAQSLLQRSADTVFPFRQDSSFFYLTGIHEPDIVLVMRGDIEFLIVPKRSLAETIFGGTINRDEIAKISGITNVYSFDEGWDRYKKLQQGCKKIFTLGSAPTRIAGTDSFFTNPARKYLIHKLKRISKTNDIQDIRPMLSQMRQIKQPEEIEAIKKAIGITKTGFITARKAFNNGASEYEIEAAFDYEFKKHQVAHGYHPIVAGGKQACVLHYIKNSQQLGPNTMCLLDVGAEYLNYSADVTRMFVNTPTQRQQAVLEAVQRIHAYAMTILKAGLKWKDFANEVEQNIGQELVALSLIPSFSRPNVRKYFPHGISHSLGLDVHDTCDYETIQENMVITVEPGIYIPEEGIGVRIEDDVLITTDGCINLSKDIPYA